jgi:hypothetical protein
MMGLKGRLMPLGTSFMVDEYTISSGSESLPIQVWANIAPPQPHPEVNITVPLGDNGNRVWRILSGGAMVAWKGGEGNLLTAIYPDPVFSGDDQPNMWVAKSKDHYLPAPASIVAYCIAGFVPRGTVQLTQEPSGTMQFPSVFARVAPGFVLVGGGARVNAEPEVEATGGVLLTASKPDGPTWFARAKAHYEYPLYFGAAEPSTAGITAFAIGISQDFLDGLEMHVEQLYGESFPAGLDNSVICGCPLSHSVMIGGGADSMFEPIPGAPEFYSADLGTLLTASYPPYFPRNPDGTVIPFDPGSGGGAHYYPFRDLKKKIDATDSDPQSRREWAVMSKAHGFASYAPVRSYGTALIGQFGRTIIR